MSEFLLVAVNAKRSMETKAFVGMLDEASDWIKPWNNTWLLWTDESAGEWYRKLKAALGDGEDIFISELNLSNRAGRMPSGFWDFVRAKLKQD